MPSPAMDISGCTREQAEELGLTASRPINCWARPTKRLHQRIRGLLLQAKSKELVEEVAELTDKNSTPGGTPPTGPAPLPIGRQKSSKLGRPLDEEAELDCFGRLLADLLTGNNQWLGYSRKDAHYRQWLPYLPTSWTYRRVSRQVDWLRAAGWVDHIMGYKIKGKGYQSMIRPTEALWQAIESKVSNSSGESPEDAEGLLWGRPDPDAPAVIVKNADKIPCSPNDKKRKRLMELSHDVSQLRAWMRTFDIEAPRRPGNRELTQIFNSPDLDAGGRYYGWWQNLSKRERSEIKLNGSSVVELDFANYHPTMLYHSVGLSPPPDCYAVDGADRDIVKAQFNRMLNSKSRAVALQNMERELGAVGRRILIELETLHAPLLRDRKVFYTGIGVELQRQDARVAASVMNWAMKSKTPLLPVHDSFIVREQDAAECQHHMLLCYAMWQSAHAPNTSDVLLAKIKGGILK